MNKVAPSTMPEISTGCLLSAMFVDIIRASIHDRDSQQGDHGSERRRFFGPEGYVLNDQAIQERVLYLRMCILQHCSFAQDDLRYRMICLYSHIRYRIGPRYVRYDGMVEGLSDSKFEIIVLFGGAVRVSRRADVLAKTTFRSNDSSVRCIS